MRLWVPSAFAGFAALFEAAGLKRSRCDVDALGHPVHAVFRYQVRHQQALPSVRLFPAGGRLAEPWDLGRIIRRR